MYIYSALTCVIDNPIQWVSCGLHYKWSGHTITQKWNKNKNQLSRGGSDYMTRATRSIRAALVQLLIRQSYSNSKLPKDSSSLLLRAHQRLSINCQQSLKHQIPHSHMYTHYTHMLLSLVINIITLSYFFSL